MPDNERQPGAMRRVAAIVGVAGAVAAGAYGLSVAAASAQTPTTKAPSTSTPSNPKADDPNCPNMGGEHTGDHTGGYRPAAPASNPSV